MYKFEIVNGCGKVVAELMADSAADAVSIYKTSPHHLDEVFATSRHAPRESQTTRIVSNFVGMWRITSSYGVELGLYPGRSIADALDVMARDAGYASQEAASSVAGPFTGHVTYIGRAYGTLFDGLVDSKRSL